MPSTPRILLIDDDAGKRFLLERRIQREFPSILLESCASHEVGFAKVKEGKATLVIANGRNGRDEDLVFVRRMHTEVPQIPIMLLTLRNELAKSALAAGVTYFINENETERIRRAIAKSLNRHWYGKSPTRR